MLKGLAVREYKLLSVTMASMGLACVQRCIDHRCPYSTVERKLCKCAVELSIPTAGKYNF